MALTSHLHSSTIGLRTKVLFRRKSRRAINNLEKKLDPDDGESPPIVRRAQAGEEDA